METAAKETAKGEDTMARRDFLKIALVTAAALSVAGGASAQEKKKITIATSSASVPAGAARIAKEMGLFTKYGIDANVTPMDTGITATSGLLAGSLDFVTTGPSDVVLAQGNGQDVVAITNGYKGFAANIVISKAVQQKSGVAANAPIKERLKVLNGLTIASTSSGSTFTVGLKTAAESVGSKVNVVYMAQPAMIAAFQTGAIDGFTVSAPYYVQPVLAGTGVMWVSGPRGDFPSDNAPANSSVVIAKRDFVVANPELTKRVVAVFEDFWKAVEERPAEVKVAMKKLWPDMDDKTLDVVFDVEAGGFKAKRLTVDDMAHDIAFMKLGGVALPKADSLDPRKMLYP